MDKIKTRRARILLLSGVLILIALICVFGLSKADDTRIHPENGVLDLKDWKHGQNEALNLSGGWSFYRDRFLSYQEAMDSGALPDLIADAPSVWNSYKIDGKALPGFGYATFLLRVVNAPVGEPLALKIPTFSTAYELYINDRLVSANGKVGADKEHHSPEY